MGRESSGEGEVVQSGDAEHRGVNDPNGAYGDYEPVVRASLKVSGKCRIAASDSGRPLRVRGGRCAGSPPPPPSACRTGHRGMVFSGPVGVTSLPRLILDQLST